MVIVPRRIRRTTLLGLISQLLLTLGFHNKKSGIYRQEYFFMKLFFHLFRTSSSLFDKMWIFVKQDSAIHLFIYKYTDIHRCLPSLMHSNLPSYSPPFIQSCICTFIYAYILLHLHSYSFIYSYILLHLHSYSFIYSYIQSLIAHTFTLIFTRLLLSFILYHVYRTFHKCLDIIYIKL